MTWDNLRGRGVDAAPSSLDSDRFGLSVVRATARAEESDATAVGARLHDALNSLEWDIAVVRWPAHLIEVAEGLTRHGWTVLPADTLLYWSVDVSALAFASSATEGREVITLEALGESGLRRVAEMVRDTFRDYPTHYRASSAFDAELVLEGYVDWAVTAASDRPAQCVVVRSGLEIAALATTSLVDGGSTLEVALAGTATRHRGRGVYQELMAGIGALAVDKGLERVLISTQASNVAVQRAWTTTGLRPLAAFTTVHVRPIRAGAAQVNGGT